MESRGPRVFWTVAQMVCFANLSPEDVFVRTKLHVTHPNPVAPKKQFSGGFFWYPPWN